MTRRTSPIGVLAALVLAAGCDRQPAGPYREDSAENAGNAIVFVQTSTNNNATPTFTNPSAGNVTVNLYRLEAYAAGDSLVPLRFATNNAQGRVLFSGLDAGQYVVRPAVRPHTNFFTGQSVDTITVTAGQTDSSATFRFRPGARVSGQISAFRNTPNGPDTDRFANVIVEFLRNPGTGFAVVATDTTDAAGNYEFLQPPGTQPYQIRFTVPTESVTDADVAARRDSLRFGGTTTSPALSSTVTFNGPAAGLNPDQTTNNFQFTLPGRITGSAFRDNNANGTQDAGENLVAGDTVNVVLLNADETRVIATSRVAVSATGTVTNYSFTSVQGGSYVLRFDPTTSRFPANPALRAAPVEFTITVPNSYGTVTQNIPVVLREP